MLRQKPGIAAFRTNINDAKGPCGDCRQGEGRPEDLTSAFAMRTVNGDQFGDV
jgi:hypothetical protein